MSNRLCAIYYPYSRCLNDDFLRRSIILFDELYFLGARGSRAPIREGDAYYRLLGRHGDDLMHKWRALQQPYEVLHRRKAIHFLDSAEFPIIDSDLFAAALFSDISDRAFLNICHKDSVLGWLVPEERMPPHVLNADKLWRGLPKPLRHLFEQYRANWFRGGAGDGWWTKSMDGTSVHRVPLELGSALYLNQALFVSEERNLIPVTDSLLHHQLLLQKYRRIISGEKHTDRGHWD